MIAMTLTNEMMVLIISQITLVLGGATKMWWDWQVRREDRLDREQDRLDRAQLAQLTLDQLETVKAAGNDRMKKLVKEIVETKKVNVQAIKAANNFNEKLLKVEQKIEASPIDVHITNEKSDPVNVADTATPNE